MSIFSRRHYVYAILSLRGLYIGKGSGERIRESTKERRGVVAFKISRHFTARAAYRAEARLIRGCRRLGIPMQNGRAPRRSFWRSSRVRTTPCAIKGRLIGIAFIGGLASWLLA